MDEQDSRFSDIEYFVCPYPMVIERLALICDWQYEK
jgi:hypothetical protein